MVTAVSCFSRGYAFPEGPRWHEGSLWFSDQHDGLVRRLGPAGEVLEEFRVPGDPSGLGWMPNGDLLVVSMHERQVYRRHEGALQVWADLRALHPGPSNDMVVDVEGRAYVGNIGFDFVNGETPCTTAVALVQADGSVELACDGLLCPNGSVISADGRTLIIAESLAFRLHAWARDANGRLGNHRVFAEFTDGSIPDGICLDAEGCVWVATAGPSVLRVREGGEILGHHRPGAGDRVVDPAEVQAGFDGHGVLLEQGPQSALRCVLRANARCARRTPPFEPPPLQHLP